MCPVTTALTLDHSGPVIYGAMRRAAAFFVCPLINCTTARPVMLIPARCSLDLAGNLTFTPLGEFFYNNTLAPVAKYPVLIYVFILFGSGSN